jgi:hypothetical protein
LIQTEAVRDGFYLLSTNASALVIPSPGVVSHHKNLLEVEDAFCHLKSYLQVRLVFHRRPDRVRNQADLLPGLLADGQTGKSVAAKRSNPGSPQPAPTVTKHPVGPLGVGRPDP